MGAHATRSLLVPGRGGGVGSPGTSSQGRETLTFLRAGVGAGRKLAAHPAACYPDHMPRLIGLLLFVGALAAAAALVPVGGRTVHDRWKASRGPSDFVSRSWREVVAASGISEPPARKPAARTAREAARPAERHTDADRAELERIVSERAGR